MNTENGIVPIIEVQIGDKVYAYNEETDEIELQEVIHLIEREGDYKLVHLITEAGEIIRTTEGHPFYVHNGDGWGWLIAQDVTAGSLVKDDQGEAQVITRIETSQHRGKVYNLTIADNHTYYVSGDRLLAHSAGVCRPPIFNTRTTNHIRGEFNSAGRFVGYHSRFGGVDRSGIRVTDIVRASGGSKNKIYKGRVQVWKNGQWVNKKGNISTFWPDGWDIRRIQQEVNAAYVKALSSGYKRNGRAQVKGPSGFDILIQAENGVIIRTHPVF